jgi:hypothetical protein
VGESLIIGKSAAHSNKSSPFSNVFVQILFLLQLVDKAIGMTIAGIKVVSKIVLNDIFFIFLCAFYTI